jgi:hypothetical protein
VLKNSNTAALSGVEALNPERMTEFDFAHSDADTLFQHPAKAVLWKKGELAILNPHSSETAIPPA